MAVIEASCQINSVELRGIQSVMLSEVCAVGGHQGHRRELQITLSNGGIFRFTMISESKEALMFQFNKPVLL